MNILRIFIVSFLLIMIISCKKSYVIGGKPSTNPYANTSTYDVLAATPHYDTLLKLIDAAGLKDLINSNGYTVFAPMNSSIYNYLNKLSIFKQNTINTNIQFGLDSLTYYVKNNINHAADSLKMYVVKANLNYSNLTNAGAYYPTCLNGDSAIIAFEGTQEPTLGYTTLVSNIPQIVSYSHVWKHFDLNTYNNGTLVTPINITKTYGVHNWVITSGIITKNGILNLLDNSQQLFFAQY